MKITRIRIHNFRTIIDADIEAHDFTMLVGANNAGKSNFMNALLCFYGELSWTNDDFPKFTTSDEESWTELSFDLSYDEWHALDEKYKTNDTSNHTLVLRRYFKGEKVKVRQNNIYAIINGVEDNVVFYGAKTINATNCGRIIYIPALTNPDEQMKTSGPSPLRDLLSFMLGSVLPQSSAYDQLKEDFINLNDEANRENGFLSTIAQPINDALNQWGVQIDFSVNPVSPEGIIKSLIKYSFSDMLLGNTGFGLDRFGHGFRRSVIFELIRLAAKFQKKIEPTKRKIESFDPDFTLLLFEEPETFLHPAQQENMAFHLRQLSKNPGQQVIITSHSPVFVSKNNDDMGQLCRIQKCDGVSTIFQISPSKEEMLLRAGGDFINVLKRYIEDPEIPERNRTNAIRLIKRAPQEDIAAQYEQFRYQLWLDSDRAAMFFADKVLLVEGASEKVLFNYLLANDWQDLTKERILVVNALGKYNFHRYISLFEAYGISHGILLDNDNDRDEHAVINQLIRDRKNKFTLADPYEFHKDLEAFLELPLPPCNEQKPLQILRALHTGEINTEKIAQLREIFCSALNIQTNRNA